MPIPINTPYVGVQTPALQTVLALQAGPGISLTPNIPGQTLTIGGPSTQPGTTITTTGTINDLAFGNAPVIWMNNASLATIQGLAAGLDGQEVVIVAVGAGQVDLAHQNAGSLAANRLANLVTSGPTSLAPGPGSPSGGGSAIYRYNAVASRWLLVKHDQGAAIAIPFSAGNFTAAGSMTWTVTAPNVKTFTYSIRGKRILVNFDIDSSSIGGTPSNALKIALPSPFLGAVENLNLAIFFRDNGVQATGYCFCLNAQAFIQVARTDEANFTASSSNTSVHGVLDTEVQ